MLAPTMPKGFDPDHHLDKVGAFHVKAEDSFHEVPRHKHRKGQLIVPLQGTITCHVEESIWMAPTGQAIWIPGHVIHSNQISSQAEFCFVFIDPGLATMPDECCTLRISSLLKELIFALAALPLSHYQTPEAQRLISVLLDQLVRQPSGKLQLPVSGHPKIKFLVDEMRKPGNVKYSAAYWAKTLALSERSFARLMVNETGLSFRPWRQQLQLLLAINQLVDGERVETIAHELGYESVTAFITMFKKALGTTPNQYRQRVAAPK
ncbi:AraC family transcriptional regulator [Tatumella sp. TA1]|uniref:AraC family transcriptional regulator n=1 Tax=Rosenbergiella collisarenosi TaxID=1544695 RepID=UPI0008F88999|nr:helix-turn-helix transcriptional regulator [Rosenbergiella collisarenosi]MBT0719979.1 AraC family transcriptional regulator [Rosenbergiella collisarenosi]QGX90591.1 AraC family transcriptional regulator [Tatumella sp. TA1]